MLTFNGVPVVGHAVSWGIDKIYDKGDTEVPSDDEEFSTYGRMSGDVSTTSHDGSATATFTRGYNAGQIVFAIEDGSVYVQGADQSSPIASNPFQAQQLNSPEIPLANRKKKSKRKSPTTKEYDYVKGIAAFSNPVGYPAPAGEEDNELLDKTLVLVRARLNAISPELLNGFRAFNAPGTDPDGNKTPGWWFAQIVGNDPDSAGYHFADLKITKSGKTRYYGAAFDITLAHVGIFVTSNPVKRRQEFGPYVKALREQGIVSWHRWAGEDYNGDGRLASVQNEMHCIDPAYHIIKPALTGQIEAFKRKESGGRDYDPEPTDESNPFSITPHQRDAVIFRETTKRAEFASVYSTATAP